jgi:hypothetical protein
MAGFNELTVESVAARAGLIREVQLSPPLRQFLDHQRNGVGTVRNFAKKRTSPLAPASATAIAIVALWISSPT